MTHLTDSELYALPESGSEAFVVGERIMRERLDKELGEIGDGFGSDHLTQNYMNNVIALARHYGIGEIAEWKNAKPGLHSWHEYRQFTADVDACTMSIRLTNVARAREYSVVLDSAQKKKLSHMLDQMRETVEKLEISVAKKDRLRSRINALQEEIDRERTAFQAFGALMIEVCDDAGEAAKRLQPVVQIVERIGAAIGIAKRSEPTRAQLPAPPKRLEGPKKESSTSKNGSRSSFDDEIPF